MAGAEVLRGAVPARREHDVAALQVGLDLGVAERLDGGPQVGHLELPARSEVDATQQADDSHRPSVSQLRGLFRCPADP